MIVITGGSGFLGQKLLRKLLEKDGQLKITILDAIEPKNRLNNVEYVVGSIVDTEILARAIPKETTIIFHLASIVSSQAEADYDLGVKVNIGGTQAIIDHCRRINIAPILVFTSSVAVFSAINSGDITEDTLPQPRSSYGTQKAICELLIQDASRRGFIDGRVCRLPTIVVRPGKPNAAASSFCSNIIKVPLNGEKCVLPVPDSSRLWIASPRSAVESLLYASTIPSSQLKSRIITLPGITTTPKEMLQALKEHGGDENLVTQQDDASIIAIVCSWPGFIDTPYANSLGFKADKSISSIVKAYIQDDFNQ